MKSAFAIASAATLGNAVNVQQSYVIDLCPSEQQVTPIYMPSAASLLDTTRDEGFTIQSVGSPELERSELLNRLEQLNTMRTLYKTQESC